MLFVPRFLLKPGYDKDLGTKSNDYIDVAFCTKFFENDKFLGTKSNFYIDVTFCTQILVKIYKFLGTKSTNRKKFAWQCTKYLVFPKSDTVGLSFWL